MMQMALTLETARSASEFVNTIGIGLHLEYRDTPYGQRFPEVEKLLHQSGIRHVREAVQLGRNDLCDKERMLAGEGVHFEYVTQPTLTAGDLAAWASCVGPAIEAFEGPNEYNLSHPASDADWAATVRSFQQRLYDAVKQNGDLRHLTVVGPSLTTGDAYRAVGNLSAYLDVGNMHNYFAGHEPGTGGWGSNGYGSIAFNMRQAQVVSGSKPLYATETGYGTGPGPNDVSEAVQGAYVPRMFLEQYQAGVRRTDEYEFIDEGRPPFGAFGLIRNDLEPKPAYRALQSMIQLLQGSANKKGARVGLDVSGQADHVGHALFEKSNGRCILAVWLELPSVEPKTGLAYPNWSRRVSVRVAAPASISRLFTYDDEYRLEPKAVSASHLELSLGNQVQFLEVATKPTSPAQARRRHRRR